MRYVPTLLALALAVAATVAGQTPSVSAKLTIGCESCGGAAQFGSIWDVSISTAGQILVTDKNVPMLRLFDQTGRTLWTGGQKGKGPGEFILPFRSALTESGIAVVDMTNTRITDLTAAGDLVGSIPMKQFATTVGVNLRGDLVLGMDNFGRTFAIAKRVAKGTSLESVVEFPGSIKNKSIALASDGSMAVALDGEKYEIIRVDANGKTIGTITRGIERPRRSAVEETEYRARLNRSMAMMSAEMKKQGGSGKVSAPVIPPDQRGLKSHLTVDGLRFDPSNRLWVHTMRGDESRTVFDVFSPSGAFLGSVTIPQRITSYGLGGSWLVTGGENEDGVPVVTVWTVR